MLLYDHGGANVPDFKIKDDFDWMPRQGRDVDLLFGLDMLKAHQACIDLEKSVLRIQGREVSFLSEHELPEKTRIGDILETPAADATAVQESRGVPASTQRPGPSTASSSSQTHGPSRPSTNSRHPETVIRTLMDLGVSREVAISTLDAAGGNVDVAASLLF
jgi:DNA damage-inducible protein 1